MKRWVLVAVVACVAPPLAAQGQTAAVEVHHAAGASSESITGAAAQLRVLGEPLPGLRFDLEGAWGMRSREESDVFGTAYPYSGRVEVIEAYAEYFLGSGRGVRSIKGGRYRTPFGISAASDHAYMGFLRPPLIRYGEYFALSTGYLEHGVDVVLGSPRLSLEVSVGRPGDVGEAIRRPGLDTVVRAEGSGGSLTVGASFIDTTPYLPARFAHGRARFGGVDVRWMQSGVQLRGEWLGGRPFDGTSTTGGYVDLAVHRPAMGSLTALVRIERLDYDTRPEFALHTYRYGAAARLRMWQGLSASVGLSHQGGELTQRRRTAIDVGLSYTLRMNY